MEESNYRAYLATFRRVPDDVVRAVDKHAIVPMSHERCYVAWIAREGVARKWHNRILRRTANDIKVYGVIRRCVHLYGGALYEWEDVFRGIVTNESAVRRAFAVRLAECAA